MAADLLSLSITSVRIFKHRYQNIEMITNPYLDSPVIPPLKKKFSIRYKYVQKAKNCGNIYLHECAKSFSQDIGGQPLEYGRHLRNQYCAVNWVLLHTVAGTKELRALVTVVVAPNGLVRRRTVLLVVMSSQS